MPLAGRGLAILIAHGQGELSFAAWAALRAAGLPPEAILCVETQPGKAWPWPHGGEGPGGQLWRLEGNPGFGAAVNQAMAWAMAQGPDWIWVQNHDARLHPGALAAMAQGLMTQPELGLVAPRRWEGGQEAPPLGQAQLAWGTLCWRHGAPGGRAWWEAEVLSAAGWLWRPEAWLALGPFDEGCFLYHEDVDLCLRARGGPWRLGVWASAWLEHEGGASTGARPGGPKPPGVDHLEWRNAWWLAGRHRPAWCRVTARAYALAWRWPAKCLRVAWRGPRPRLEGWWALALALVAAWRGERGRPARWYPPASQDGPALVP